MDGIRQRGRPKSDVQYQKLHIRLPYDVQDKLMELSKQKLLSMNAIILLALADYFEKIAKKETK